MIHEACDAKSHYMPAIMNKIFVAQLLLFLVVGIEAIPLAAKPHPVFLSKGVSSSDISWEDCSERLTMKYIV